MSILINVQMPETCGKCPCYDPEYNWCNVANRDIERSHGKPDWCPLVKIPTPHGKLVDLDAMVDKFWDGDYMEVHSRDLGDIPVIVEAEADHE